MTGYVPGTDQIEVAGGGYLDLLRPDPADVRLEDVAHSLAHLCRFTGHTRAFYSVAEHAVVVAKRLAWMGASPAVRLAGLHHDDAEAYLGDVSRPLKKLLPDYAPLERNCLAAIKQALGLDALPFDDHRVKGADDWALALEARYLLPSRGVPWAPPIEGFRATIRGLDPPRAKLLWLESHRALWSQARR